MVATVLKVHVVFKGSGYIMIVKRGLSSEVIQLRPEHYWLDGKDGKP